MNTKLEFQKHSHRRLNILNGQWVLVAPHRTQRAWQGQVEKTAAGPRIQYDPDCYLCPGNKRASGGENPDYQQIYFPKIKAIFSQRSRRPLRLKEIFDYRLNVVILI